MLTNRVPHNIRQLCMAALLVGFRRTEIKQYIHKQWPEMDATITYALLSVWKKEAKGTK